MSENRRIILDTVLKLSEVTTTEASAYWWKNVEGVQPPTPDTPMDAEHHVFILNGVEYQCNYFLNGETKYKASYKADGVDTIMLELIKDTGLANIKLRRDKGLDIQEENNFTFFEILPPVDAIKKRYCLNVDGHNCIVYFNDGAFTIESED